MKKEIKNLFFTKEQKEQFLTKLGYQKVYMERIEENRYGISDKSFDGWIKDGITSRPDYELTLDSIFREELSKKIFTFIMED